MVVWYGALEIMGLKMFNNVYNGKRVLITGHTGFKGSWLSLWLHSLGAKVYGIGLDPVSQPSHWEMLELPIEDYRIDLRDPIAIQKVVDQHQPEIIFHLAAQPLVRRSYIAPIETWSTNVVGTLNLLEAARKNSGIKAIVVITTDKCYENREWCWGYRENDALGGHDPYSASKAAVELVVSSYQNSFFNLSKNTLLATARAGNVIGGGDWSEDRLVPDLIRSIQNRETFLVRSPQATRPWQHVLESLSGYLMLGQRLLSGEIKFAGAWNFGPELEGNRTVSEVVNDLSAYLGGLHWRISNDPKPHEATLLYLDSSKSRTQLGWAPIWDNQSTLEKTADWYKQWMETEAIVSRDQLNRYVADAVKLNAKWART